MDIQGRHGALPLRAWSRNRSRAGRLCRLAFWLALALGLAACEGKTGNADSPEPAAESATWDSMTWDQGKWS